MKRFHFAIVLVFLTFTALGQKPRILVTTDIGGDPDDQQALVRLMVYANEYEIEGLVSSAAGTPGELKEEIINPEMIKEIINGYAKVYPNLQKHDAGYIPPAQLLAVVKEGNPHRGWENVGQGNDTEGSEWIIKQADKEDARPLNICIFGGQTDVAQALWKVKNTRTAVEYQQFIDKIRVYDIMDQDRIFNAIIAEHPTLFYILSKAPQGADKREGTYRGMYLGGNESLTSLEWLKEHVIEDHGPLGKLYPTETWTDPNPHGALKEGDTPSWFFFLDYGLGHAEHPEYGGWGGRYQKNASGYYTDAKDHFQNETNARATIYRWRDDFQQHFAARMDWCVEDFDRANHAPKVSVQGFSKQESIMLQAKDGEILEFNASGSTDPDGDELHYEWMVYPEAGNLNSTPNLKVQGAKASVKMPKLAADESLHIILRVTDKGSPALTSYERIIIKNP